MGIDFITHSIYITYESPEHEGEQNMSYERVTIGLVSSSVKTNKKKTKSANCVECKAAIYVLYVSLHHVHSFKLTRPSLSRA